MIEINYLGILVSSLVVFFLGALWYSPILFGKAYMKIMEVENLKKEELQKMQAAMLPYYFLQLVMTVVTTFCFSVGSQFVKVSGENISLCTLALVVWGGFIVPTQVACVIWGKTKQKFWIKQILIMISYQLVAILLTAYILKLI